MIVAKVTIFLKQTTVYTLQIIILFAGKDEVKKSLKKDRGEQDFLRQHYNGHANVC